MANDQYPGYRPSKWADPSDLIVRHRHGAPKEAIARMREEEAMEEDYLQQEFDGDLPSG